MEEKVRRLGERFLVIALLIAASTECVPAFQIAARSQMDGDYIGLRRMANIPISPNEKNAKWFHENELLIRDKQVVIDMSPVYYLHGTKCHSASDGGFMTYRGEFFQKDGLDLVRLRLFQSDYVIFPVGRKPYEELKVYPVKFLPGSLVIDGVRYKKTKLDPQREKVLLGYLQKEPVIPPAHRP